MTEFPEESPGFDWELRMAEEAGVLAKYELLERREREAKAKAKAETERPGPTAAPVEKTAKAVGRAASPPMLSEEEALIRAEDALHVWGRWNRYGAQPAESVRPRGYRSQFAPPSEWSPRDDDADLAAYVERAPGFGAAFHILWRVYVDGWIAVGASTVRRLEEFRRALAGQLRTSPYRPPKRLPEVCEADHAPRRLSDEEWVEEGKRQSRARRPKRR